MAMESADAGDLPLSLVFPPSGQDSSQRVEEARRLQETKEGSQMGEGFELVAMGRSEDLVLGPLQK